MELRVVTEDRVMTIDGKGLTFDFELDTNIGAIQWDGSAGEVEYNDATPNLPITDFSDYQYLVDAHAVEKQRVADVESQAEVDRLAAMTYADKRALEYPDSLDYLDGIVKGDQAQIDTYIAACQAVKDKYPKP
jgi:hypothetical protein